MSEPTLSNPLLERAIDALAYARHGDPFAVLGPHQVRGSWYVRAWLPGALAVNVVDTHGTAIPLHHFRAGFFEGRVDNAPAGYYLQIEWPSAVQETEDPYAFGTLLSEDDLHHIIAGTHSALADCLGAHVTRIGECIGVRFAVWARNAQRVSVVGDFNTWDGRRHPMRLRYSAGVWEIFIPRIGPGERYKFEIVGADGQVGVQRADPLARQTEKPPATASIVASPEPFLFSDQQWMHARAERQGLDAPLSIYEVHTSSWCRQADGEPLQWRELAERLIPYVQEMGFTHVELLPIMEHPFGGSWGYQPLSMFAPTARHGSPADFAYFVNACHEANIGVILDWVPAHFPSDAHGLVRFDGTALYEHEDPREGLHPDWNTLIYNLGRNEVVNFLVASAQEWLGRYHADGLRVDAVASMLYRDYSREPGHWLPNIHGGRENLEAIAFLRELNLAVREQFPGAIMVAEESTAWPGVTAPAHEGGLAFHYKWNMGWMHDTLRYMGHNPIYRSHHHHDMTFGLIYAWSENFILPLSHDEVVHGKGSLIGKMPGDEWQHFANLRAYFGFMWTHPGKKLMFMGGEIAQTSEWNHDAQVDWSLLDHDMHRGMQRLVKDLNHVLRSRPALHQRDTRREGFEWVIGDDHANSVFAYLRKSAHETILVVCNMTPVPRHDYQIGVPVAGRWAELLNTDAAVYGGSNVGNGGQAYADATPAHGHPYALTLVLPPLATLILHAGHE